MNISQDIKTITYLKTKTVDLLEQVNETHRPVIITQNGEAKAVLQDPESYENMKNAIGLLKILSLSEEEIKNDDLIENEKVLKAAEKKLK